MNYRQLGRCGVKVSPLCLGTLNFGNVTPRAEALRILDEAEELGINFIDTANNYGGDDRLGAAERIIGEWLARDPSRRDRIVLCTKVCNPMGKGPNERGLSVYHIRRSIESSLKRLGVEYIDLYQMHKYDETTTIEESIGAMRRLVEEGKALYIGCSNWHSWQMAKAQELCREVGFFGLASGQNLYNLMERKIELELEGVYRHYGIGLLPWSPLAQGLLAGSIGDPSNCERLASAWLMEVRERFRDRLEAYERFCLELGRHPAEVAIAWLLSKPFVTAPIIGPRSVEHLRSSVAAVELRLDSKSLDRLEAIWPGAQWFATFPPKRPKVVEEAQPVFGRERYGT